ncbi:crossover junction endodeoxyribonuclease RuvC [Thiospirochaeta perfilievii]|uniref:Crossover junction endodeoxyribonuclease RuvC n=1 Tax=Thiospirochaeta perfilievii TaxID=252967 RepID=A0A5C1Q5H1_9SPIO|nr:crossover junction endodeoxyribonuclease RuvC [Thiospirochaeta perfilievii]QEN03285.1 crossover junction endodeoxyribonuclease RuvC [Thiospirochaeta perfilievii]
MVRVIGIDPGLANTGWGIIETDGIRFKYINHGTITTTTELPSNLRLKDLYNKLSEVIKEYKPSNAGIETLYFAKNVSSALPVAQARGVQLLALGNMGIKTGEYTPIQIKQAVVGNGRATKKQVQDMVKLLLKLKTVPKPDHAADALAAAICHVHSVRGNV